MSNKAQSKQSMRISFCNLPIETNLKNYKMQRRDERDKEEWEMNLIQLTPALRDLKGTTIFFANIDYEKITYQGISSTGESVRAVFNCICIYGWAVGLLVTR